MQPITSRDNPFFKQLVKLGKSARQRRINRQTLLDGNHLIQSYYAALGAPTSLIIRESVGESTEIKNFLLQISPKQPLKTIILSDALFHLVSPVKTPTGIMALIPIPETPKTNANQNPACCILLEAIQDPGNLGSILRTAAAAGVNDVYLSSDCSDVWSPKTLRAAMGAHFLMSIHEHTNLIAVIQQFNGKIITTSLQAKKSLYQTTLTGSVAFVFGNEGNGLSDAVAMEAGDPVTIPMPGKTESLNVAAAAAVCLFERVRQQNTIKKINKVRL